MNTLIELTLWQKKQAALLYHFSSTQYLQELYRRIGAVVGYVDGLLELARDQDRDRFLGDKQWGERNTASNWSNNAWPFLEEFRQRTASEIADRKHDAFYQTGSNDCSRGMSEISLLWATPEEEKTLEEMVDALGWYALPIDDTMNRGGRESRWDDYSFAYHLKQDAQLLAKLPRFKLRTDIEAETGKLPPKTGVYIPQDDVHGSLQFAWTGGRYGELLESSTFNQIGLDALKFVGRRDLWSNDNRMYEFARSEKYRAIFETDVIWDGQPMIDLASSAVARSSFKSRSCKWFFVELVPDEFEDYDDAEIPGVVQEMLRVEAGQPCPKSGYYLTPASDKSRRHFKQGEIMPNIPNAIWQTIWQSAD